MYPIIILMSIRERHAANMGYRKWWEFRKRDVTELTKADAVMLYETAPFSQVGSVCVFDVALSGPADKVWELTRAGQGLTREAYDEYYQGHDTAYAAGLGCYYSVWGDSHKMRFEPTLKDIRQAYAKDHPHAHRLWMPPQSWMRLPDGAVRDLMIETIETMTDFPL